MVDFGKNKIELVGHYGGDETHALSAWTSTSREITGEKAQRRQGLLNFLAENGHHTPFEKSSLHFLVTTDIATHIHILKHRVGVSVNGESARYKELKGDKCYIPIEIQDSEYWSGIYAKHMQSSYNLYHECLSNLENEYGRDRAKEVARFFLPYSNQIKADVMFNWRSFAHFLDLRLADDAQVEVKEIADAMLTLVKQTGDFEETIKAFGY